MKMQTKLYIRLLLAAGLVLTSSFTAFAQSEIKSFEISAENIQVNSNENVDTVDNIDSAVVTEIDPAVIKENLKFLDRFKEELKYSTTNYRQIQNDVSSTQYQLSQIVEQKVNLEYQIENLDNLIASTTAELLEVIDDLIKTDNELSKISEQIEIGEIAFEYQKQLLMDYTEIIYKEENNFISDPIRLLLTDGSVGENLKELKYIDMLNETGQNILDKLDILAVTLENNKSLYATKLIELQNLQNTLITEKKDLEDQKEAKDRLLVVSEGQEKIYSQLLQQSIDEQSEALNSVRALTQAISIIDLEIKEKGDQFNPDDYKDILSDRSQALYDFHIRYRGLSDGSFDWPVDPFKGLSAYFRDPGYAGAFGVRHSAVDIPTYQGTPIRSAGDGLVFATKDNGYGYSYVIVAHANGLSTVYGHVSDILVREGDYVAKGSIIALSGGMPGTKGAGYMTTGPHLHFEVHKDGDYVDPLLYLPIEVLTEDQMQWLPEAYKKTWKAIIHKNVGGLVLR